MRGIAIEHHAVVALEIQQLEWTGSRRRSQGVRAARGSAFRHDAEHRHFERGAYGPRVVILMV